MVARNDGLLDGRHDGACERRWGPTSFPVKLNPLHWLKVLVSQAARVGVSAEAGVRPTAYLDGLRGFASLIVYWHHQVLWSHQGEYGGNDDAMFENAWGYQGRYRFATFYGVRTFFSGGHFAVATFYLISGYVLALKPLSLIQAGEYIRAGDSLASSLFRRWLRLYIPLLLTTFLFATSWHVFGFWNKAAKPKNTYADEAWAWYTEFFRFSFVFRDGGGVPWLSYNMHLWSIPLEMRGSLVIFTTCLALSRVTTKARLLCESFLIFYFMYICDGYYCSMFLMGMLQCDLDLLAAKYPDKLPAFVRALEGYGTFVAYHLLILAMLLSGVPSRDNDLEHLRNSPGWFWAPYLKPQAAYDYKWFFLFWAATFLIWSVARIPWLKRFFESRFCQYLGRISFALYLVHGPILTSIGDRVYYACGWIRGLDDPDPLMRWRNLVPIPKIGPAGLELSFLLPNLILLPLTLWVADLTTRFIDDPALQFSSWLYRRLQGGPADKEFGGDGATVTT